MERSDHPSTRPGGSVIGGAVLGVTAGFLTMWLPLYLFPDYEAVGIVSIGFTVLALVGCIIVAVDSPNDRRTFIGCFWGVIAGAVSVVLLFIWALSQIGS